MRVKRHGGNLGAEAWRVQLGRQYQVLHVYIISLCFLATFCSSWSVVEINVLVHG